MGLRAFIYGGGPVLAEGLTESPKAEDLCIAADSGYQLACRLGHKVDILVGDMDSLGISIPEGTMEVHRLPTEKDLTDVQVAVELAVGRGADEIIIVSSLSGRLDHTLSTLAILEDMRGRGIHAYVTDGQKPRPVHPGYVYVDRPKSVPVFVADRGGRDREGGQRGGMQVSLEKSDSVPTGAVCRVQRDHGQRGAHFGKEGRTLHH